MSRFKIKKKLVMLLLPIISRRLRLYVRKLGVGKGIQFFIIQRIFRINGHVPWPVHWSSYVGDVTRINLKTHPPYPGLGIGQYIQSMNGINFGENVRLGPGVKIISANHNLCDYEKHVPVGPVTIGDNCWIGAGAVILPGVTLGDHVVVGAGSVVTKDFPDNCVIVGVPAKMIKCLGDYEGCKSDNWVYFDANQ